VATKFSMLEEAKKLSTLGPKYLKQETIRRTQWHSPIPEVLKQLRRARFGLSYDREILFRQLENAGAITLMGDAAHPESV
jgi:2-polyprenyl-6-methoxyphenol hydroxylase-like FAD-dependent oxidoreductase